MERLPGTIGQLTTSKLDFHLRHNVVIEHHRDKSGFQSSPLYQQLVFRKLERQRLCEQCLDIVNRKRKGSYGHGLATAQVKGIVEIGVQIFRSGNNGIFCELIINFQNTIIPRGQKIGIVGHGQNIPDGVFGIDNRNAPSPFRFNILKTGKIKGVRVETSNHQHRDKQ